MLTIEERLNNIKAIALKEAKFELLKLLERRNAGAELDMDDICLDVENLARKVFYNICAARGLDGDLYKDERLTKMLKEHAQGYSDSRKYNTKQEFNEDRSKQDTKKKKGLKSKASEIRNELNEAKAELKKLNEEKEKNE